VEGVILAVACAIAATAYPSWKAARLDIVDALRRIR
jgi:ABC-type antimicrobial peptide transport system permease subunit